MPDKLLSQITPADIEIARARIEDALIEFRDLRVSLGLAVGAGHGLVVKEPDGQPSSTIRITTGEAIKLAIEAILESADD